MVFESLVADLLNRYIGEYVQNLDKNQLKIGIWGGDVVLKNLILKQSALDELNLPIRTIYGRLGQLTLKIPWKNLYSSPVEASVDTLYLLAVPNQEIKYDAVKEDQWKQDAKQKEISKVELAKQQEKEKEEGKTKAQDSFVEKLATQIIRNVQVFIKKIHIRYEDRITHPSKPFAAGITLHNLTVHTTDGNWLRYISTGTETDAMIYKMLNLEAASVYWNSDTKLFTENDPSKFDDLFLQGIADKTNLAPHYRYILGPINATSKLRINSKPESDFSLPKITLELDLERLQIRLSKDQYKDVIRFADSLSHMGKATLYRKYRPTLEVYQGFSTDWWKFAYTCILEEQVRRNRRNWQWSHMKKHIDKAHQYEEAWKIKITSTKLNPETAKIIEDCENYLDSMNVILRRQNAENQVERDKIKKDATAANQAGWFGWWRGGGAEAKESKKNEIVAQFEEAMTSAEKEKLYRAIGYSDSALPGIFPESFVEIKCNFVMHSLEIEIRDEELVESPRVLIINLKQTKALLEKRPVVQGLKVLTSVELLSVFGLSQNNKVPQLVISKRSQDGEALLDVLFEVNPLCKTCDQRIHVTAKPLQVVYDAQTLIQVSNIFTPDQSEADVMYQLQEAAATKMIEFKEMSALGLQNAITKRTVLDLDVRLMGSYLLLPHGGHYTGDQSLLVVNLGSISVTSKEKGKDKEEVNVARMHRAGTSEEEILKELVAKSYDQFVIQLTDLQVMITYPGERWLDSVESELYVLRPTSLSVNLDKCLIMDDPRLPKLKVLGELPKINIKMAETRLLRAFEILLSIPQKEIEAAPVDPIQELVYSSNISLKKVEMKRNRNIAAKKKQKEEEDKLMQFTEMEVKFILKEFSISLEAKKGIDTSLEPLLDFSMLSFELEMTQKTFDMIASVKLGGLELIQHYKNNKINVIKTPQEKELFSIEYNQINKKSPEFKTHGLCLQLLNVNFSKMDGIIHQEALLYIWKWITDITMVINKLNESKSKKPVAMSKLALPKSEKRLGTEMLKKSSVIQALTSRPSSSSPSGTTTTDSELQEKRKTFKKIATASKLLSGVKTDSEKTKKELEEKKRHDAEKEVTDLKIRLHMDDLNFSIHSEKTPLARFDIDGIHLDVVLRRSYTKLQVTLNNLGMFNSLPDSYYDQIMSVPENKEALTADIIMFNNDDGDMEVVAHVAQLRFIFLNKFTTALLDFINQFQAGKQAIIEASQAAVASAKQNLQDMYVAASKIKLDISIDAPVLVIPTHSKSRSAILMDFGNLKVKNSFENLPTKNVKGHPAVIDHIQIELENMKMSRVLFNEDFSIKEDIILIQPINLNLLIKRNLCVSWFKTVPDLDITGQFKTINLILSKQDYATLMEITTGNLAEGQPAIIEPPPSVEIEEVTSVSSTVDTSAQNVDASTQSEGGVIERKIATQLSKEEEVRKSMQFNFLMESMELGLRNLAMFTLSALHVHGDMYSNGKMITNVTLKDCLFDDTRILKKAKKVTRYMERKVLDTEMTNMIEVHVNQDGGNMNTDLRISSFNLIMNLDYIMKVLDFVSVPPNESQIAAAKVAPIVSKQSTTTVTSGASPSPNPAAIPVKEGIMTINLKLEKPDLILVENLDDLDTNAIIMNTEITCKVRLAGTRKVIEGTIKDLQVYSCVYNPSKRDETMSQILRPVTISLAGSTPEGKGLHMEVHATPLLMSVSPATIEMLNRINQTIFKTQEQEEAELEEINYIDLWNQKQFYETDYWFLKTERAVEALDVNFDEHFEEEICVISMPKIIITLEAGLPMILTEISFHGKALNFSSKLSFESTLKLQVRYYNTARAIWEPLIEPVEQNVYIPNTHAMFELEMTMETNDNRYVDTEEEFKTAKPGKVITIGSKQNMEITITKKCLNVLTELGKAFNQAISLKTQKTLQSKPLFIIDNQLGITISIDLTNSNLTTTNESTSNNKLILNNKQIIGLNLLNEENKDLALIGEDEQILERFIKVEVPDKNVVLNIPISKADERFYPLEKNSNGWALVVDISVHDGTSNVILRSNVQIFNELGIDINIYCQLDDGKPDETPILLIKSDQYASLPLTSLSTPFLYFSTITTNISETNFNWKQLQTSTVVNERIRCNPNNIEDTDPTFLNIIAELEQIYYENTNKHTMVSNNYKIIIRPTVIIKNDLPLSIILQMQGVSEPFELEPGCSKTLVNVEPGTSSVIVKILNYLNKDWICKTYIKDKNEQFNIWKFEAFDDIEVMVLNLGMHVTENKSTLMMDLYCPFWMINKTDLSLTYKSIDDSDNRYHPADHKGPLMFSFKEKSFFDKKKACIKVERGEWSDKFSLDAVGSSGCVDCTYKGKIYYVGVHINLTSSSLTKMVLFMPYYVIINNCSFGVEFTEIDKDDKDNTDMKPILLDPQTCASYWPPTQYNPKKSNERVDASKKMKIRIDNTSEYSVPFPYSVEFNDLLKLKNKYGAINVEVHVTESSAYVTFNEYKPGMAPLLIINHTGMEIDFHERYNEEDRVFVKPGHKMFWAWSQNEDNTSLVFNNRKVMTNARSDGMADFFLDDDLKRKCYWLSFLDGIQRVLLVTEAYDVFTDVRASGNYELFDQEIVLSMNRIGVSLVDNDIGKELMYLSISSSGIIWESQKSGKQRYKTLKSQDITDLENAYIMYNNQLLLGEKNVNPIVKVSPTMEVNFETFEMSKPSNKKVRRVYESGLWLQMKSSSVTQQMHLKLHRLQIDNQMVDAIYPVIMAPVPLPKTIAANHEPKPFIEVSIVQKLNIHSQVRQYKYYKVLIQEFHVKVELGIVTALSEFFAAQQTTKEAQLEAFKGDIKNIETPLIQHVALHTVQAVKNYYDILHFSPLKMHVSFTAQGSDTSALPEFLSILMQSIGVTLTDIHDVLFKLSFFERKAVFLNQPMLVAEATSHYTGQFLKQAYVLVLGLDVLGNPYGLVTGLATGVEDLFYEPFQGAIQGPGEFAEGLMIGARSFVSHTVGGAAGAASRITGAMGKGIAALTFDKEYQRKRRLMANRHNTIHEDFAQSGKGLVQGFVDGVSGVVTKPISGAKDDGAAGFVKGVGKGMIGLFTRPAAGVVDFASGSFNAVKRVADTTEEIKRNRAPRLMYSDGIVKPYCVLEAEGNSILHDLEKGKYIHTDNYIYHTKIFNKDILLLTNRRLVYLTPNDLFGGVQIEWEHTWTEFVKEPKSNEEGIQIELKTKKKTFGLFGNQGNVKILLIKNEQEKSIVLHKMIECYQNVH